MKTIILAFLMLFIWIGSSSARTYTSTFGFSIDIPSHWLILSKQELKNNPDLFDHEREAFGDIDPSALVMMKIIISSRKLEVFLNRNTGDTFQVVESGDRNPKNSSEREEECERLSHSLSNAFGKHMKFYACVLRNVAGLNAFYVEHDGPADGTRIIQYSIEISPDLTVILTATCGDQSLQLIKEEIEAIVTSIEVPQESSR